MHLHYLSPSCVVRVCTDLGEHTTSNGARSNSRSCLPLRVERLHAGASKRCRGRETLHAVSSTRCSATAIEKLTMLKNHPLPPSSPWCARLSPCCPPSLLHLPSPFLRSHSCSRRRIPCSHCRCDPGTDDRNHALPRSRWDRCLRWQHKSKFPPSLFPRRCGTYSLFVVRRESRAS